MIKSIKFYKPMLLLICSFFLTTIVFFLFAYFKKIAVSYSDIVQNKLLAVWGLIKITSFIFFYISMILLIIETVVKKSNDNRMALIVNVTTAGIFALIFNYIIKF